MAAPPYLTTMVFPAKRCMYGSASASMDTLSRDVSFATADASCQQEEGVVEASQGWQAQTGCGAPTRAHHCCCSSCWAVMAPATRCDDPRQAWRTYWTRAGAARRACCLQPCRGHGAPRSRVIC
jgi:hypothetical protein